MSFIEKLIRFIALCFLSAFLAIYVVQLNLPSLNLEGASGNNLKNINIKFPLGKFISVTGVSGGGKSSLIIETLYKSLSKKLNLAVD